MVLTLTKYINVKTIRKIVHIFVAFSGKLNFTTAQNIEKKRLMPNKIFFSVFRNVRYLNFTIYQIAG